MPVLRRLTTNFFRTYEGVPRRLDDDMYVDRHPENACAAPPPPAALPSVTNPRRKKRFVGNSFHNVCSSCDPVVMNAPPVLRCTESDRPNARALCTKSYTADALCPSLLDDDDIHQGMIRYVMRRATDQLRELHRFWLSRRHSRGICLW